MPGQSARVGTALRAEVPDFRRSIGAPGEEFRTVRIEGQPIDSIGMFAAHHGDLATGGHVPDADVARDGGGSTSGRQTLSISGKDKGAHGVPKTAPAAFQLACLYIPELDFA